MDIKILIKIQNKRQQQSVLMQIYHILRFCALVLLLWRKHELQMVGGVAEGAKSGTSVLGKEGKKRSGGGRGVQNLAGDSLMSLGNRIPSDTLALPSKLLGEEWDRCQTAGTDLKSNQTTLCTLKLFGVDQIISILHQVFPPAFRPSSTFAFLCLLLP